MNLRLLSHCHSGHRGTCHAWYGPHTATAQLHEVREKAERVQREMWLSPPTELSEQMVRLKSQPRMAPHHRGMERPRIRKCKLQPRVVRKEWEQ